MKAKKKRPPFQRRNVKDLIQADKNIKEWEKRLDAAGIPRLSATDYTVEGRVEHCMQFIDERGQCPLTKKEWVEMLESIIYECRVRLTAAREEMREETKGRART
jgi:hypothetical protein